MSVSAKTFPAQVTHVAVEIEKLHPPLGGRVGAAWVRVEDDVRRPPYGSLNLERRAAITLTAPNQTLATMTAANPEAALQTHSSGSPEKLHAPSQRQDRYRHHDYYGVDDFLGEEHLLARDAVREWVKAEVSPHHRALRR